MAPIVHVQAVAVARSEPLQACFGVGCAHHHRCARYEAVVGSEARRDTLGTCLSSGRYPMFIALAGGD
jgi:hypothetical protein